ncbi:unnamed protein product [Symbiodinium natans]|uniref:Cytochrome b5 heme-binding domain-containing protein n=1 Tax=Symbiodinium natans TaxID=878477 RepID=A0A812M7Q6_9DINO|nr:unnamed protein product [Symbiodinium natans]
MPLVMPAQRKPYTVEEVIKHNTPSSLWVIMNRKVYDVTAFHKKHPGGPGVLLQMGGKDATAAAAAAHKSILPANLMWEFCIGYIVRTKPQEEGQADNKPPVQKKAPSPAKEPSPRSHVEKAKSEVKSVTSSAPLDGLSDVTDADSPLAKARAKNKRRSPPSFLADVERMLTRPVMPTKCQDMNLQHQKQKPTSNAQAQAERGAEEGSSPEAAAAESPDMKPERSFTTIMEEMESDIMPMSDVDAVTAPEPPPSGGLLCFFSSTACWSGRPSVVQQVAHDDKAVADGFG